jgi:hypothetical protein
LADIGQESLRAFRESWKRLARQQALKDLEDENKALPEKIRQVRGG